MSEHQPPTASTEASTTTAADEQTDTGAGWSSEHPIAREQQMVFGDDGDLEPDGDSVETSLEAFGADIDHSDEATQLAEPAATQFGVDDRQQASQRNKSTTSRNKTEGDQRSLFADVNDDQQTLGGENAATRCLFDSSGDYGNGSNGGDEKS